MLKRPKVDPRPKIREALPRQYWATAEQVARAAGVRDSVARAELKAMHKRGEADLMPGRDGKQEFRKRKSVSR